MNDFPLVIFKLIARKDQLHNHLLSSTFLRRPDTTISLGCYTLSKSKYMFSQAIHVFVET